MMTQEAPSVSNGKGLFAFEWNLARGELDLGGGSVYAFAHSGAELAVDGKKASDGSLHEIFEIRRQCRNKA